MTPLTPARLREMIECAGKATPGPWAWCERRNATVVLAAPHGGVTLVMDFGRKGMQGAEPLFGVTLDRSVRGKQGGYMVGASEIIERDPDKLLRHPDAEHIAACSPEVIIALCRIALAAADESYWINRDIEGFDNEDWREYAEFVVEARNKLRDALREAGL